MPGVELQRGFELNKKHHIRFISQNKHVIGMFKCYQFFEQMPLEMLDIKIVI